VTDDLRQRYAQALAEKFTSPTYRSRKIAPGEYEDIVENPEPADRIDRQMWVHFTASDGHPSTTGVTCEQAAEVCAAVRDEEMAALHQQLARAEIAFDDLHVEAIDLGQRAEQAEAILRELIDPSPCDHFDHHGQCQTHGRWDDQGRCLDARGRELLVALDEPEAARD
jgi:hypothetical protein